MGEILRPTTPMVDDYAIQVEAKFELREWRVPMDRDGVEGVRELERDVPDEAADIAPRKSRGRPFVEDRAQRVERPIRLDGFAVRPEDPRAV